jgi:hypothetical protein
MKAAKAEQAWNMPAELHLTISSFHCNVTTP